MNRVAVIDKKDIRLQVLPSSLKAGEHTIPFRLMDMLILNHRISLASNDLLKLTQNGVSVMIVSHDMSHYASVCSMQAKNSDLKIAQYSSLSDSLEFARDILTAKLTAHARQLEVNGIDIDITEKLADIKRADRVDELLGIEGSFARTYFRHFFSLLPRHLHKGKRSKRPPADPVNALMSFWYMTYYNIITVKLVSYGFDASLGYLHKPFRSHNALSSDIMEYFRAAINQAVLKVFERSLISEKDFAFRKGVYLRYSGRKKTWREFARLARALEPLLEKEISLLRKKITSYET